MGTSLDRMRRPCQLRQCLLRSKTTYSTSCAAASRAAPSRRCRSPPRRCRCRTPCASGTAAPSSPAICTPTPETPTLTCRCLRACPASPTVSCASTASCIALSCSACARLLCSRLMHAHHYSGVPPACCSVWILMPHLMLYEKAAGWGLACMFSVCECLPEFVMRHQR